MTRNCQWRALSSPSVPGTYASRFEGPRAAHPGQGERPDQGPDHYRGSTQGETHPAEGATPTQDHGPEEALRPSQGLNGLPHGLRGQRPLTGLCYRSQEEEMTWDDGAGIDAGCWSERRIPPPRP